MKKNWMLYWGMLLAVVAITMFAGAGISYFVYTGDLSQMIIPSAMLVAIGLLVALLGSGCVYVAGKGEILTAKDFDRKTILRLKGQIVTSTGSAILILEDGTSKVKTAMEKKPFAGQLPDCVKSTGTDFVPANYQELEAKVKTQPFVDEASSKRRADAKAKADEKKKAEEKVQSQE